MMSADWQRASACTITACVEVRWHKAYASYGSNNCVEVGNSGVDVFLRDTKDKGVGPVLRFTDDEWRAFIDGVKKGEFDIE